MEGKVLGITKWIDQEKGFGIIIKKPDEEYFLHSNDVKDSVSLYQEGSIVIFEPYLDQKKNRLSAKDTYLFSKPEHWKILQDSAKSHYLKNNSQGEIEFDFPNILYQAAIQFARLNSPDNFIKCLKQTFLELKDIAKFDSFVAFSETIISKSFRVDKRNDFLSDIHNLYYQNLSNNVIFYSWKDKKLNKFWELSSRRNKVISFLESIESDLSEDDRFDLFTHGLYPKISISTLEKYFFTISKEEIEQVIQSNYLSTEAAHFFFPKLINKYSDLGPLLLDKAKAIFSESNLLEFEEILSTCLSEKDFLELWFNDKLHLLKGKHLSFALKDNKAYHEKAIALANEEIISLVEIKKILIENIVSISEPTNRPEFNTLEQSICSLIDLDQDFLNSKVLPENQNIALILWAHFDQSSFDFNTLKGKFIYFSPEKQVEIIKRLFHLKAIGQFDLTVGQLSSLTKFDLDLYLLNQKNHPEIPIDISTDLIIKLLESIQNKGEFFLETDLITIILQDLIIDQTKRFKLDHYFEKCKGRTEVQFEKDINGYVEKIPFGGKFYFAIEIEYHRNLWKYDPDPNPEAEKVKRALQTLPGIKYNQDSNHWGVPSKYEEQVLDFIRSYKLRLNTESNYSNSNKHLAWKKLSAVPNGITFCEGRAANKKDSTFNENFWWCNGMPCLNHCETIHEPTEWKEYTFLDFLRILNINTDETTSKGEFVPKGKFYRLMTTINRFNELLKKLYCKECNHILHPVETGNFGARNVTRFHCINEKCKNEEIIYLNHCLNGKCNNVVDSRDSRTCPNGLYICDKCGCCCSHSQMSKRLENLKTSGGSFGKSLENAVFKKLGHLERRVFFCYSCGGNMKDDEKKKNILICEGCKVEYNLTSYRHKFPHTHLPKEPTDVTQLVNPPKKNTSNDDLPF